MRDKIEAILFAAGRYLDEDHIAQLLGEDKRKVKKGLAELKTHYDKQEESALQIVQEEHSWKMHVKDTYLDLVSKLVSDKEIAKTVLETLAVIAWKTPIMQAELIKIRGPAGYEHVNELIERGFITKEALGRSFKLKVTDKFLEYFDVEGREGIRKLFKQVEEKLAPAQAEVDQAQREYDEQQKLAQATQAAIDAGEEPPTTDELKAQENQSTSSKHSAQKTRDLVAEVAEEIRNMESNDDEAIEHSEEELAEIHEDIRKLHNNKQG